MSQEPEATGPGIVVLSPSLHVLHINRRAIMLLDRLKHTRGTSERSGASSLLRCSRFVRTSLRPCENAWHRTTGNNFSNAARSANPPAQFSSKVSASPIAEASRIQGS